MRRLQLGAHLLVGGARGVHGREQRRGLVGRLHELARGVQPQVGDQALGQPHGKRVLARERLQVGLGVAEGELVFQGRGLPQHGVGQPARLRGEGAHQLHALVHRRMGALVQEVHLVHADAQRVAHVVLHVVGRTQAAVDDLVERPARAHHAQHEARGEGAVLAAHARGVDVLGDEVLREGVPLAQEAPYLERRLAGGRDVEALLGLRRLVGRLDLAPGPVAPLAVAGRAVALRLAAVITVALRLAAIPVREGAPATPFPFARGPAVLGSSPLAVAGRAGRRWACGRGRAAACGRGRLAACGRRSGCGPPSRRPPPKGAPGRPPRP